MLDYADEANLHTRIYAMRSRLLSLADYAALARDQDEALPAKTGGGSDSAVKGEMVFQEQIAGIIPLAAAGGIYAPLFLAFFRQFEALNVKLILAKAFGLMGLEQWYDIGPYALLQRSLLQEKTDLKSIQTLLTGTYLADVLQDVSGYEQMETRVDLCAARNLYAASVLFPGEEKRNFQDLMNRRIAMILLILSIRLKRTYQWDDDRIHASLESFHDAFGGKIWPQVKILEEMLARHLEGVRAGGAEGPSVVDIEHYLEQYHYQWISSVFHRDFHSIYCVVAYLLLLFYQIRNLLKIIEGRRFGFSPERIISRIVCNA